METNLRDFSEDCGTFLLVGGGAVGSLYERLVLVGQCRPTLVLVRQPSKLRLLHIDCWLLHIDPFHILGFNLNGAHKLTHLSHVTFILTSPSSTLPSPVTVRHPRTPINRSPISVKGGLLASPPPVRCLSKFIAVAFAFTFDFHRPIAYNHLSIYIYGSSRPIFTCCHCWTVLVP
jgi:hypothetical protein